MRLTVDWVGTSLDDLWWFFNELQTRVRAHRAYIAANEMTPQEVDLYAVEAQDELENIRQIVAELRRRGERVEWEG